MRQLREFFLTNFLNVGTFLLVTINNVKDVIEIALFITLIIYNVKKISQLFKTKKRNGYDETEDKA